jgi:hypothetical protein
MALFCSVERRILVSVPGFRVLGDLPDFLEPTKRVVGSLAAHHADLDCSNCPQTDDFWRLSGNPITDWVTSHPRAGGIAPRVTIAANFMEVPCAASCFTRP